MHDPAKRPVEPADLFRLKFIQAGTLSPDGRHIAYVLHHVDPNDEKPYAAIWLVSTETGESRQLTSGTAIDSAPAWSPDGKQIAFTSTRAETPQIYLIAVDGGEARPLTSLKQGVGGGPVWSPDGKHIAFTARHTDEKRDPAKPYRVKRAVYRFNEMEYLDDVVQSIFVVGVSGGEPRQVTKDERMNTNLQWSADGKELLYLAMMEPSSHRPFLPSLRIVNLVDGSGRDLLGEWGYATSMAWLPDGRIVFDGQPYGLPIGSKSDMWVIPATGGEPENRTAGLKFGVGGGLEPDMPVLAAVSRIPVSADGQTAYINVQDGGTVQIYRVALNGPESFAPVVTGARECIPLGLGGGKLALLVSDVHNPTDLYVVNEDGSGERRLTQVNAELLAGLHPVRCEHLNFPGIDGTPVEGWFFSPSAGNSAAPYPTVLLIHGGPHGAFGNVFNFNAQMLVGAGYGVLMINHRASTGYGDSFSTAIKGDWGNLDYNDLMAGVDHAIAQGLADPDRLGLAGLSGGGNLTCWTVGQTTRFKAAVPENPVTNWVSFYGVSDIGVWFATEQLGGHPHEIPDVYARCSPITYAHRCKTPTLLVQAEHDWRCPPEQSEQFYTVLRANGCIAEMLRMPDGAHAAAITGAPHHRRAHNEALLGWMNQYVLGQEPAKGS